MPHCPATSTACGVRSLLHAIPTLAFTVTATRRPFLTLSLVVLILSSFLSAVSDADKDKACELDATFDLKLQISFTPSIDPSVDDEASQIPIILAAVHTPDTVLFRVSQRMNDSVAEVASRATALGLEKWFKSDDGVARVSDYEIMETRGATSIPVEGSVDMTLRAKGTATRLTIMVHLSPSPAWFAGLDAYDLCTLKVSETPKFVVLKNLDAGLDKGRSFQADPDPYPQGETVPVSMIDVLENEDTVILSMTRLPPSGGGVAWWIPTVGSMAALVAIGAVIFLLMRYRIVTKGVNDTGSHMSRPLFGSDRVEW